MTQWRYIIDISDLHERFQIDLIDVHELAEGVSQRIRKSKAFRDQQQRDELDRIADWFDEIAREKQADVEEYDNCLAELYDWGDTWLSDRALGPKLCWINTFRKSTTVPS